MTFTQLEIFALVAELRGFTAAAMRLGVSQSAISHAIKSLEGELGVQLIERQGATADVTELGAVLTGDAEGRRSDEEITIFDSTGLAIQDLAIAIAAYERAGELDLMRINL
mgnify:CR=1 FL=1